MTDKWDEMRRVKEEEYFNKRNQEAMERLRKRPEDQARLSPVTGEPMVQKTILGVVVDQCPTTGGIWLDAGELDTIIKNAQSLEAEERQNWLYSFFGNLMDPGKKK